MPPQSRAGGSPHLTLPHPVTQPSLTTSRRRMADGATAARNELEKRRDRPALTSARRKPGRSGPRDAGGDSRKQPYRDRKRLSRPERGSCEYTRGRPSPCVPLASPISRDQRVRSLSYSHPPPWRPFCFRAKRWAGRGYGRRPFWIGEKKLAFGSHLAWGQCSR